MGYTHYWKQETAIPCEIFNRIVEDFKQVIPLLELRGITLFDAFGKGKVVVERDMIIDGCGAIIDQDEIVFNGDASKGEDHETFGFERVPVHNFNFCKTAQKPYDLAVTTCLVIVQHHAGDLVTISSDGDDRDWEPAVALCNKVFWDTFNFKLGEA